MSEYTGPDRRGNGGWELSKSMSVSHIIGTLMIAVGFFAYITDIEKETVVNKMDIRGLAARMDRTDARHNEQFGEIKDMLSSISDRLTELADRRRN